MMNGWMDSVPPHRNFYPCFSSTHPSDPNYTVKWNPKCENQLFLRQSAALHAVYYHLQTYIHRPFIPSPRNPLPGIFPSLAICTNAARSCCHVLEVFAKSDLLPFTHLQVKSALATYRKKLGGKRLTFLVCNAGGNVHLCGYPFA